MVDSLYEQLLSPNQVI